MEAPDHGGSAAPQHCDESAFHRTDSSGRLLALLLVFAAPAFQLRDLHLPVVPLLTRRLVRSRAHGSRHFVRGAALQNNNYTRDWFCRKSTKMKLVPD